MTYKIVKNFPQDLPFDKEGPFISIYQTTQVHPFDKGNIITFKNLMKEALSRIEEQYDKRIVEKFSLPLQEIVGDLDFWLYATQGIAVFVSQEDCIVFQIESAGRESCLCTGRHSHPSGSRDFSKSDPCLCSGVDERLLQCLRM
jgi:hypothetical protein